MSTTKAKKAEKAKVEKTSEVWILTIFYSPYKEDFTIKHHCFRSYELARRTMKEVARKLYQSEIIQEADDKYFDEDTNEIHFGESPYESDYRREFGYCEIECVEIEDEKK
ncbi:3641_t:CDS:2 [Scutellospora calospora]|uniref:3641_t:CDS:1 n=1 Tax=Scutellospora calospora TaxID=85575 RepID=A0ACA9LIK8_9GLOM|nr:3641_t:CDS:2 [Scutellospora calospora]